MNRKRTIAVIFGGFSPEHDVSVVSAQQFMDAVDPRRYDVLPVYLDFENNFYTGPRLRQVQTFRPKPSGAWPVRFFWGDNGPCYQIQGDSASHSVDCVVPLCHGAFGEDGRLQASFELMGLPVTGFSAESSAFAMRKEVTKAIVKAAGANVLPHVLAYRHQRDDIETVVARVGAEIGFPVIVKPSCLGSSIGVGIATTADELRELVLLTFYKDSTVLIEPQVQNLVEYNIAVMARENVVRFSAIERPKSNAALLDFKEKYLSSSGGAKGAFLPSEGMLSLTRDVNPVLPKAVSKQVYDYARSAFEALGRRGAPRIDFLCDEKTGEVWFNEINPIPGSYGFFLWEAALDAPLLFPELINHLVEEAIGSNLKHFTDPVPQDAYLLPR